MTKEDAGASAPKTNASLRHEAEAAERFALEALDLAALTDVGTAGELQHRRASRACRAAANALRAAGSETRAQEFDRKASEGNLRAAYVEGQRASQLRASHDLADELRLVRQSLDQHRDAAIFWASHLRQASERDSSFRRVLLVCFAAILLVDILLK